jgi:cyclopropane-fatty-acyl-phospholipid synthase
VSSSDTMVSDPPGTPAPAPSPSDPAGSVRAFFDHLFPPPRDFAIRLWDGTEFGGESGARYTLVLSGPGTARRMFALPVELSLGEGFIFGDYDIEGDLAAAFDLKDRARAAVRTPKDILALLRLRRSLPHGDPERRGRGPARLSGRKHSRDRDAAAIQYHYDVGNEFYRLWLDDRMVYTCAYFRSRDDDLDTAQEAKLDLICRKLRLRPGETLLDIGCGWGGFLVHAARRFGVRGVGVTLSEEQHRLAGDRVARAGLEGEVEIRLLDYRDLTGTFDKIASIGMFEAIGPRYEEYFTKVHSLLAPGGLFMNHSIHAQAHAEAWSRPGLATRLLRRYGLGTGLIRERYIFPDGELTPVSRANLIAEEAGFEVRDVENLREHYAMTLRHWVRRLEACRDEAVEIAGDSIYRTWRLYLTSSAREFDRGSINLQQSLLSRPVAGQHTAPLTREDLYT